MPTGIPRWCREMASGCWGLGGWWSERLPWDVTMNKHTLWDEVNCWIWGDFKHAGCCGHICHLSCALLLTFPVGNFWVALFIGSLQTYRTTNTHPIIGGGMAGKSIDVSETPFFDHQSHLKQPVFQRERGGKRSCGEIGSQEWNLLVRHLFCSSLTPDLLASKRCCFEALIMSVGTGVLSDGCKACIALIVGQAKIWRIPWESMFFGLANTCYPLVPANLGRCFHIFSDELATFANHQRKRWPFQKPNSVLRICAGPSSMPWP